MCGIAGIFDTREKSDIDRNLLESMTNALTHRGPDESGLHLGPGIGLGHRRLSIIDLATGQQPMYSVNRDVTMIYNGEVYNYQSVREDLEKLGHKFKTNGDTEVVMEAWNAWKGDSISHLRGMFAHAIWDAEEETLFLARDRVGIKPLYYSLLPNGLLIFGSELKALLRHPQLPRDIDPHAVEEYFAFGYIPDPRTILKHVKKLEPGFTLTTRRGQPVPEPVRYWDVPFEMRNGFSEREIREELIERAREAVRIRLVSEVPLGAFLSGGVDSSSVVAMMAGLSDRPVETCSISFGDPTFNESQFAQQVADQFKPAHRVKQVDPDDFDLIDKLADVYDEPYADSSAMPTYRLCEVAREQVTVALSGDGGDENFAGYRRYRWHMYEEYARRFIPAPIRKSVFGTLGALYPKADWAPKIFRAKTTFQGCARDSLDGYFHTVSVLPDSLRAQLFSDSFTKELQGYEAIEVFRHHARNSPTEDPLSLAQYLDFKTYLPGDILTKVDRASMAHSLEVRVPLLDHVFVEWISSLTPKLKLKNREGKYVFKRALEAHLPNDILYRPKMGFAVPLARWFRGPLKQRVRDTVLGPCLADSGIFDPAFLQRLVDDHQSGISDYSAPLWSLVMFEAFQRRVTQTA